MPSTRPKTAQCEPFTILPTKSQVRHHSTNQVVIQLRDRMGRMISITVVSYNHVRCRLLCFGVRIHRLKEMKIYLIERLIRILRHHPSSCRHALLTIKYTCTPESMRSKLSSNTQLLCFAPKCLCASLKELILPIINTSTYPSMSAYTSEYLLLIIPHMPSSSSNIPTSWHIQYLFNPTPITLREDIKVRLSPYNH